MDRGQLKREVGVGGAVLLGLGSILGTGVFVSIGLGVAIAGPWVVLAIALAAVVATCNGLSSAQLAAAFPVSGGTYEYGYRTLHPAAGFTAGWMFLLAKSASAATAALGFAAYLLQAWGATATPGLRLALALGATVALTLLVIGGLRRSTRVNAVIVGFVVLTLVVFIAVVGFYLLNGSGAQGGGAGAGRRAAGVDGSTIGSGDLLHAAALMFVAYTGYGRIATLGEEVRSPARTIPLAIMVTLAATAVLYIGVAATVAGSWPRVEGEALAAAAPLEAVAGAWTGDRSWLVGLVAVGAIVAMLGVLLNLILGLSRVLLAMGRRRDAPGLFAKVNAGQTTPVPAVLGVAGIIVALALVGDVETTWSFSAFTVLIYYGLTNAAALRLPADCRRYPRAVSWAGLVGCLSLAFFVPRPIWLAGLGLIGAGLICHAIARRRRGTP